MWNITGRKIMLPIQNRKIRVFWNQLKYHLVIIILFNFFSNKQEFRFPLNTLFTLFMIFYFSDDDLLHNCAISFVDRNYRFSIINNRIIFCKKMYFQLNKNIN